MVLYNSGLQRMGEEGVLGCQDLFFSFFTIFFDNLCLHLFGLVSWCLTGAPTGIGATMTKPPWNGDNCLNIENSVDQRKEEILR